MTDPTAALERRVTVAAPQNRVWELDHDVSRLPEWSPSVVSTRYRDALPSGAELTNLNLRMKRSRWQQQTGASWPAASGMKWTAG